MVKKFSISKWKKKKKLAEIEGHVIERHQIPDYIDPEFAKEKRLYPEQNTNKEKNDLTKTKKKSNKSDIDKKRKKKTKN